VTVNGRCPFLVIHKESEDLERGSNYQLIIVLDDDAERAVC